MTKKIGYLIFGVAIGLALMLAAWRFAGGEYTYRGSLNNPPVPAAEISLTDQNEQPFRLADHRGQVVLIFFGYTNCPDVCPVTMSEYRQIKKALGDRAEGVRFVLVTVDPERDTPEQMKTYLANFDPQFTGLTGPQSELEKVWKSYGVYREKQDAGSAAGYLMDHSGYMYAIDKGGNWRLTYAFGTPVEDITQDVRHLLAEN